MNISDFFSHWSIEENPFRGEEARHDDVLTRLNRRGAKGLGSMHSDFEKILGELARPSTSIVFGEKGSGKTAIRLQIAERTAEFNEKNPDAKIFLINYDDLNRPVAELEERFGGGKDGLAPFKKFRLVDHMDSMLAIATDRIVAALFGEAPDRPAADLGEEPGKSARRMAAPLRQDLLLMQAIYDPADIDGDRTARLRRMLRLVP